MTSDESDRRFAQVLRGEATLEAKRRESATFNSSSAPSLVFRGEVVHSAVCAATPAEGGAVGGATVDRVGCLFGAIAAQTGCEVTLNAGFETHSVLIRQAVNSY